MKSVFGKPAAEVFQEAWAWVGMIGIAVVLAAAIRTAVALLQAFAR